MRLVAGHCRAQLLEYARYPSFTIPSLAFPALFFLVFVAPRAVGDEAGAFTVAYAAFAVLGIVFFHFGVGISIERVQPWERYLRTLPVAPAARFTARIVTALAFAAVATAIVVTVAATVTGSSPALERWPAIAGALAAGAVPHALLGIALGYLASPRGALPIANLLYLGLSYAGGLWTTARHLPSSVERVSPILPTRQWAELLWAVERGTLAARPVAWLGGYTVLFGLLALWAYRRDEGERFS